jgi:ankyrin repeat protein
MIEFNSLRHAAATGDAEALRKLIEHGAPIGELDNAPLRWALRHQRPNIVALLLDAGAEISANAPEFLSLAAKSGDVDSLKLVLHSMRTPILPNCLDHVLYDAIQARKGEAVKILLEAGANAVADENKAVLLASSIGDVEILEILQAHGADLCALDSQPLFNAVMAGDASCVRLLLSAGANANARLGIGLIAISNGDSEIMELLLAAGGKLPTPGLVAHAADCDSIETLLLLAEHGYPYEPYADEIAISAARSSSFRILKFILEKSIVSQPGCNIALINAAAKPSEQVLDLLLHHGADAGDDNSAALKTAINARHFAHAKKLLAANAYVPDLDSQALWLAIEAHEWSLLVTLLRARASVVGLTVMGGPALEMFECVSPADMLRDSVGNFLPKQLRDERKVFVRASAQNALAATPEQKIHLAQWLAGFLTQYNSAV